MEALRSELVEHRSQICKLQLDVKHLRAKFQRDVMPREDIILALNQGCGVADASSDSEEDEYYHNVDQSRISQSREESKRSSREEIKSSAPVVIR